MDYRLAPAHPFPAAVLDVLAALSWANARAGSTPVAVGGDSAGGTIAACASLAIRNSGGQAPRQVLAYPPLDPECSSPPYSETPGAFPDRDELRQAWRLWLGTSTTCPALPAPWATPSLAGLAPVHLIVGEHDPVRDDVIAHGERLRHDEVPTTVRVLLSTGHGDLLDPHGRVLPALAAALNDPTTARTESPRTEGHLL